MRSMTRYIFLAISIALVSSSTITTFVINKHRKLTVDPRNVDSISKITDDRRRQCNEYLIQTVNWFRKHRCPNCLFLSEDAYSLDNFFDIACNYIRLMEDESKWNFVAEKSSVKVWKAKNGHFNDSDIETSKWPCILSRARINSNAIALAKLILDSSKVHLYNKLSIGRTDVQFLGDDRTKVVWNRLKNPIGSKGFDFCTLIHCSQVPDGTIIIMTKNIQHPAVPKNHKFQRSEIIFGINILRPLTDTITDFTSISHIKYTGVHPFLISRNFLQGTVDFVNGLQSVIGNQRDLDTC